MTKISTKRVLADQLKLLMKNKTIDKISISDITTAVGVNRQTFYYHFADIFDLLKWTIEQESIIPLQVQTKQSWEKALPMLFAYLEENREFALSAIHSLGHDPFKRFFYQEVNGMIAGVVEKLGEGIEVEEKTRGFLSHFYTISISSLAISWLQGEVEYSPDEMIQMLMTMIEEQTIGAKQLYKNKIL